jgi:hypothetical protein
VPSAPGFTPQPGWEVRCTPHGCAFSALVETDFEAPVGGSCWRSPEVSCWGRLAVENAWTDLAEATWLSPPIPGVGSLSRSEPIAYWNFLPDINECAARSETTCLFCGRTVPKAFEKKLGVGHETHACPPVLGRLARRAVVMLSSQAVPRTAPRKPAPGAGLCYPQDYGLRPPLLPARRLPGRMGVSSRHGRHPGHASLGGGDVAAQLRITE